MNVWLVVVFLVFAMLLSYHCFFGRFNMDGFEKWQPVLLSFVAMVLWFLVAVGAQNIEVVSDGVVVSMSSDGVTALAAGFGLVMLLWGVVSAFKVSGLSFEGWRYGFKQ